MLVHDEPGAVIAAEDDQGSLVDARVTHGLEDLADAPVHLLDHVAVQAARTLARELRRGEQRHVRHVIGQVQEEGFLFLGGDKLHRLFSVAPCERRLLGGPFDDLLAAHERHIPVLDLRGEQGRPPLLLFQGRVHVVDVGSAEEGIEAVPGRQVLRQVPEVPLTKTRRGVAAPLQGTGEGDLVLRQPAGGVGEEDSAAVVAHAVARR